MIRSALLAFFIIMNGVSSLKSTPVKFENYFNTESVFDLKKFLANSQTLSGKIIIKLEIRESRKYPELEEISSENTINWELVSQSISLIKESADQPCINPDSGSIFLNKLSFEDDNLEKTRPVASWDGIKLTIKKQGQVKPLFEGYPSESKEKSFLTTEKLSIGAKSTDISKSITPTKADYSLSISELLEHSAPGTYEIAIKYQSSKRTSPSTEKLSIKKGKDGQIAGSKNIDLENVTKIIKATAQRK